MAWTERDRVLPEDGPYPNDDWVSPYLCKPRRSYAQCLHKRLERQAAVLHAYWPFLSGHRRNGRENGRRPP